jgi:hypothetical protein
MQILKALILPALLYTTISAAGLNYQFSARGAGQLQAPSCNVDGEHCDSSPACCASFYCASRGVSGM